jgi:hypothetical protein
MILLVLFLMISGLTIAVWATWRVLGILEQWATRAGLTKSSPIYGTLSIIAIVSGILGVVAGVRADTGIGVVIALASLGFGPMLGIFFGVASLMRRERVPLVTFLGLLGSLVFVIWRWGF